MISHIEHKIAIKITSDPSYKPYSILKAGRNQWILKIKHQLVLPNIYNRNSVRINLRIPIISHTKHKVVFKITSDQSYNPYFILKAKCNNAILAIKHQLILPIDPFNVVSKDEIHLTSDLKTIRCVNVWVSVCVSE